MYAELMKKIPGSKAVMNKKDFKKRLIGVVDIESDFGLIIMEIKKANFGEKVMNNYSIQ